MLNLKFIYINMLYYDKFIRLLDIYQKIILNKYSYINIMFFIFIIK